MISTAGDRTQASGEPLPEIGGKGLFTAELERALRDGDIDLAVHSLKDLPTEDSDGVVVGAVSAREDVRDCVVARDGGYARRASDRRRRGDEQPSPRRAAARAALRSRRALDPRERRHADREGASGEYDAVVLAAAGVRRLGLEESVTEWLEADDDAARAGTGRARDPVPCRTTTRSSRSSRRSTSRRRAPRRRPSAPSSARSAPAARRRSRRSPTHDRRTPRVRLQGLVASVDGSQMVRVDGEGDPHAIGDELALEALAAGADRILAAIRG